jgi:DNA-binding XRE family transcriptional regulator
MSAMDAAPHVDADVMNAVPHVDARELAGAILRAARAHAGLSQRELAAKIGVAVSTIGRAEGSQGPGPSWALLVRDSVRMPPYSYTMRPRR